MKRLTCLALILLLGALTLSAGLRTVARISHVQNAELTEITGGN